MKSTSDTPITNLRRKFRNMTADRDLWLDRANARVKDALRIANELSTSVKENEKLHAELNKLRAELAHFQQPTHQEQDIT